MDLIDDRRGHPRRLCQPERPDGLSATLPGRPLACHRRLALRHERHTTLHAEIRAEPSGALDRSRADAYPRPHREPSERDRELQAGTLLGAGNSVSRYHLYSHQGQVHLEGGRRESFRHHRGQTLHSDKGGEERGQGTAATTLRPHLVAGGLQPQVRLFCRDDAQPDPSPLREEIHHLSPCGYAIPERRYISQMSSDTQRVIPD